MRLRSHQVSGSEPAAVQDQGVAGAAGLGGPGAGGQDGAHVTGTPATEGNRPIQRCGERVLPVGRAELVNSASSLARRLFPRRRRR